MPNEPSWLSVDQIIEINRLTVAMTREPHLILDRGLLENAYAKPINHWHYGERNIATLSVKTLFGIAQGHAFQQGNKRTGFLGSVAFLKLNGYEFIAPDSVNMADAIIDVIEDNRLEVRFLEIWRGAVVHL